VGFDGATYAESLFIADVDMHWSLPRDTFYLQMPRHGLLAFFPMRGDGYTHDQYRIIGRLPREWAHKEHITHTDLQQLLNRYSVVHASVTNVRWTSTYRIHKRMAAQFRIHRVFLVGDAAHIHSPAGGQGMNTGIQDAWNLAWKVALVVRGEAQAILLNSYEPERMPIARTLLNGTDRGFSVQASSNYVVHVFRSVVLPLVARLGLGDRLGARVFKLVSQTWINYRNSPVVAGDRSATTAQPGDRAPYARFDVGPHAGESIFMLLRGVDHHLLLFIGADADGEAERMRATSLLATYELITQVHVIDSAQRSLHAAYDVQLPTALLVRPDGHIAWRGALRDMVGLTMYLDRLYMQREQAAPIAALA
jgi:hypothetical protein